MTEPERWAPVLGFEGFYEVSTLGRVRSLDRFIDHGAAFGGARTYRGQIRTPRVQLGRPYLYLYGAGCKIRRNVHVLVLEAFVGPRPPGMDCCHNDGGSLNNRLDNLRWDTRSENIKDTVRHGTHSNARKTHCVNGHPLTPDNLARLSQAKPRRVCLRCSAERHRKYRRRDLESTRRKTTEETT